MYIFYKWDTIFFFEGMRIVGCVKQIVYPSSFGGVNQPFFSCICMRDLKDCWALANEYW